MTEGEAAQGGRRGLIDMSYVFPILTNDCLVDNCANIFQFRVFHPPTAWILDILNRALAAIQVRELAGGLSRNMLIDQM